MYTLCSIIRLPDFTRKRSAVTWDSLRKNLVSTEPILNSPFSNEDDYNELRTEPETMVRKRIWNQLTVACIASRCGEKSGIDRDKCALYECHNE